MRSIAHSITLWQLGRASLSVLVKKFGVFGEQLKAMGNGILDRPLETEAQDPKSIGHSITLPQDIWKREDLTSCLLRLSERVGRRARRHGYKGRTVTLTVRYADFKTFTKQTTLSVITNDTGEIYRSAVGLLDTIHLKKTVRLLGVSLSSLSKGEDQLPLFHQPENGRKEALAKAVDAINDKFGEHTVTHGSSLSEEKGQRVISPAWRPSGVRKSDV